MPYERDVERVAHDVREGWISVERAFETYGVSLDVRGQVDPGRTASRRAWLRAEARRRTTTTAPHG
jgi:N-methylhydantoinase B